jgi:hypothetical protein
MFKLYYSKKIISSDKLTIEDKDFSKDLSSTLNEGFIGFFDWLRSNEQTIIGIRICYFENQPYNDLLMSLPYILPTFGNKCMELLFEQGAYLPDISGDQDFTNNYVFKSADGASLFTFGVDSLTDKELNSLLSHCTILSPDDLSD